MLKSFLARAAGASVLGGPGACSPGNVLKEMLLKWLKIHPNTADTVN